MSEKFRVAPVRQSLGAKSGSPTRKLLIIGFGGLLLLIAFAALNAITVVRTIENRNERIRVEYLKRDRILQSLRSDLYLSGTYVRDLLLAREPDRANLHLQEFEKTRQKIDANVDAYGRILLPDERKAFSEFTAELHNYFSSLDPALKWTPIQRQNLAYAFINDFLLPRRVEVVRLADQLGNLNQKQLEAGNQQVKALFSGFQHSLAFMLVICLASGVILTGLSIHRVLRLETVAKLHLDEVTQARSALRDLSSRLLDVQELERKAIARELHDEIGQAVSGLLLGIGNVAATLSPESSPEALAQLQELRRVAERTVAEVRDMSLLLRPSMLDDLGLLPALQWQAREVSRTKGILVQVLGAEVSEEQLSDEQKTCIYRVVQEALQNVLRHSKATAVKIHLSESPDTLTLRIEDNGRGFSPVQERGLGLLGMEERVHHLNGSFHITSQQGGGAAIQVELPVSEKPVPEVV
jgi:signal transduction histidine kinase